MIRTAARATPPFATPPAGGVKNLNHISQKRLNAVGEELLLWNLEFDQAQGTGLRVGDPVICLANDWKRTSRTAHWARLLSVEPPVADCLPETCWGTSSGTMAERAT